MGFFRSEGVVYKPADEVNLGTDSDEAYLSPLVKAPRMAGFLVKLFAWILRSKIFGVILLYFLKKDNLIHKLVSFAELEESPLYSPLQTPEGRSAKQVYEDWLDATSFICSLSYMELTAAETPQQEVKCMESSGSPREQVQEAMECLFFSSGIASDEAKPSFRRWTIMDYARAYTSGALTPSMVAERFIKAVERSCSPESNMSFFISYDANDIVRQAAESTLRYKRGEPLSVLDGVPIAIKDEIDCTPYPTTGGTKWLHRLRPCRDDACCVKRLRSCGALLVGKTNMHELGAGTSGINPHYGATRNPYNASRVCGGSSSGSAAVVCAGLCPVSLGVDGGAISGQLPYDQPMISVPKVNLPLLKPNMLSSDITLAKYEKWFDDCSADIKLCCSNALDKLQKCYGWKTLDVTIPEIETMRLAHYITIGSECTAALHHFLQKLSFAELGWDVRVALSIYGAFNAMEYIKAQRIRGRQMQFHRKIFSMADVIVTPTTGVTAYPIKDDALKTGELDYINGAALVRYQIAGNFLGLPAVTVPIGYDKSGLPIGLQFIGRPWAEATLLHIAYAVQALYAWNYRKPKVYYDLLS
ncbi:hypothetical protein Cgig2_024943 [Carnegiea gigantea]|uniref:Amidase domain-containing protein n=1 Tax=Carnegiea gigantea TaxID=171969 RepID=A0A9Q1KCY0_9CARY|nr:hypothetical protein Cgig2_024943 [Carnegiea gigantea]